jgi:hypothetical protein
MSLKEVCDLSSILSASEVDQNQLESKLLELDTAIGQQEQRVSHFPTFA